MKSHAEWKVIVTKRLEAECYAVNICGFNSFIEKSIWGVYWCRHESSCKEIYKVINKNQDQKQILITQEFLNGFAKTRSL